MRYFSVRAFGMMLLFILAITSITEMTTQHHDDRYWPFDETFTIPGNLAVGSNATITGTTTSTGQLTATAGVNVSNTGATVKSGTNTPEGAQTAPVGSLWLRTNGGAGTSLYVKETGASNTGWTAIASSATTSSTIGSITSTFTAWANGFNVTTEGTRDWAAYNQNCNSPLMGNYVWPSIQAKPWVADRRAGRLYQGIFFGCNGSGNCNGSTVSAQGSYSGNGISTSTGANNFAGTALSANATGCDIATGSSNNAIGGIRFRLFASESAFTLKIYMVLVDVTISTRYSIIENGVETSNQTSSLTTTDGSTKLTTITVPVTPGSGQDSWFEFKFQRTSTPTNFNPHAMLVAATMF